MNTATSDLAQAETRMRPGREPLNPMIRTALILVEELHRRPLLVVRPTSFLERILALVVIMILKLICFNGHLLMDHGPLGLMRDWMGYGTTRACLTQIHLLDDIVPFRWGIYVAVWFICGLPRRIPCRYDVVNWNSIMS